MSAMPPNRGMKLEKWALGAEIVSALAVVITLIFLIQGLRDNTRALEAATRQGFAEQDQVFLSTILDPSVVARASAKLESGEELSALERSQLIHRQHLNFRIFEHAYSQYQRGVLDEREWSRYQNIVETVFLENVLALEMWQRFRAGFDQDFARFVDAAVAQDIESDQSGFAPISNGRLYYEQSGIGQPLILIHGNAGDRRHWDHQFLALADGFRVIRYDVRGFGRSSFPEEGIPYSDFGDLRQLLDHLRIDRAHIAGWSMGSGIAVDFVVAYPERALSLVAVGPWVNGHTSPNATAMFADFGGVLAELSENGAEAGAEAWMKAPFFAATIRDPSAGAEFRRIAQDYSWWALLNNSPLQALEPSAVERLESIQVPTLVLTAEYDISACLEVADLLEQRIPGAFKIVMAETGHLLHMEQPGEFNTHLVSFLEGARE